MVVENLGHKTMRSKEITEIMRKVNRRYPYMTEYDIIWIIETVIKGYKLGNV